ncbi:YfbU family protein [Staphylococcus arlettae]
MVKLTDFERLSLINQFEILNNQNDDNEYSLKIEVLKEGLEGFYDEEIFSYLANPREEDKRAFVSNVLSFYRDVINSFEKLADKDKTEELERKTIFYGFDLHEPDQIDYFSYAVFYLEKLKRYKEIKDQLDERKENIESHGFGPSMEDLSRYIERRKKVREDKDALVTLSKEEMDYIFQT